MRRAIELLSRLASGRQDLDTVLAAVNASERNMDTSVGRISAALDDAPTREDIQRAINDLTDTINQSDNPNVVTDGPTDGTGVTGATGGTGGTGAAATATQSDNRALERQRRVRSTVQGTGSASTTASTTTRGGSMNKRGGYYYGGSPVKTKTKRRSITPKNRRRKSIRSSSKRSSSKRS